MRRRVVVAVTLVLGLAGCTGGGEPDPTGSPEPAATASPTPRVWTAEDLAEALLGDGTPEALGEPVATTTGTVTDLSTHAIEMQVLSLEADERTTTLRYLLRTTDGSSLSAPGPVWTGEGRGDDTRAIALVDDAAGQRLQPYTAWTLFTASGEPSLDASCACSDFPYLLDERAVPLSATFPPLSEGTDEVVVEFPGSEPVSVPVTWPTS